MIKPLSQRVVLTKIKEEEKKVGSLLLPGSSKVAENVAKVVAVSEDVTQVKVNDTVVFEQFDSLTLEHDGQDYIVVKVENIAAIIE